MSDIIREEEVEQSSLTTILVTRLPTDADEAVDVELAQESPPIVDNSAQSRKLRKNQLLLQPSLRMKPRNDHSSGSMTPIDAGHGAGNDFPLANLSASNLNQGKQTVIAPVSMFPTTTRAKHPGTVPSKHKTVASALGQSTHSRDRSNSSRRLHHLANTNTSHFSNWMSQQSHQNILVESMDNGSNFTARHDKKKLLEMRKELILMFRFFCLDKEEITRLLRGPTGSISDPGQASISESQVHSVLT